jgi:hypothetical protein
MSARAPLVVAIFENLSSRFKKKEEENAKRARASNANILSHG